jgi:hypothetical protein
MPIREWHSFSSNHACMWAIKAHTMPGFFDMLAAKYNNMKLMNKKSLF